MATTVENNLHRMHGSRCTLHSRPTYRAIEAERSRAEVGIREEIDDATQVAGSVLQDIGHLRDSKAGKWEPCMMSSLTSLMDSVRPARCNRTLGTYLRSQQLAPHVRAR